MLRLNAFLLVGGLAAFVAGTAAGFKVLAVQDDKPEHALATVTNARAAPRPAAVVTPKAEETDLLPPLSTTSEEATNPSPPPPAAATPSPTRIAEAKSERSDAPEAAPAPATASPKKAERRQPTKPRFVPKPRFRDDDDDDDDC